MFLSDLHERYARFLEDHHLVKKYEYLKAKVNYTDGFTGEEHVHYCTFKIYRTNDTIEHVQVTPINKQMPLIKYLYAENRLEGWRWITEEEIKTILGKCVRDLPKQCFCKKV